MNKFKLMIIFYPKLPKENLAQICFFLLWNFLFDNVINERPDQDIEDPYDSRDSSDESIYDDFHEHDKSPNLWRVYTNLLFQLEEEEGSDINTLTYSTCIISFDIKNEFKGFPIYSNPFYSSLEHGDSFLDQDIVNINTLMHITKFVLDLKVDNHPSDVSNTRKMHKKHLYGWKALQDHGCFYWVLTIILPSPNMHVG